MILKRKTMARAEWKELRHLTVTDMPFECPLLRGRAGLLWMKDIREPFSVPGLDGNARTIIQNGYSWLQIAPENECFWATVMFNESGRLFEAYFDITLENHALPEGKSWFIDLLLDLVWIPREGVHELDRDELDGALKEGAITAEQRENALKTAERVKKGLSARENEFVKFCEKLRKELIRSIMP